MNVNLKLFLLPFQIWILLGGVFFSFVVADCPAGCMCETVMICRGISLNLISFRSVTNYEYLDMRKNTISAPLQVKEHWNPEFLPDLNFVDFRFLDNPHLLCDSMVDLVEAFPNTTFLSECSTEPPPFPPPTDKPPHPRPAPPPPPQPKDLNDILMPVVASVFVVFLGLVAVIGGTFFGCTWLKKHKYKRFENEDDATTPKDPYRRKSRRSGKWKGKRSPKKEKATIETDDDSDGESEDGGSSTDAYSDGKPTKELVKRDRERKDKKGMKTKKTPEVKDPEGGGKDATKLELAEGRGKDDTKVELPEGQNNEKVVEEKHEKITQTQV